MAVVIKWRLNPTIFFYNVAVVIKWRLNPTIFFYNVAVVIKWRLNPTIFFYNVAVVIKWRLSPTISLELLCSKVQCNANEDLLSPMKALFGDIVPSGNYANNPLH